MSEEEKKKIQKSEDGGQKSADDVPKKDDDVPKSADDVPKKDDDVPKKDDDVPKKDDDVPKKDGSKESDAKKQGPKKPMSIQRVFWPAYLIHVGMILVFIFIGYLVYPTDADMGVERRDWALIVAVSIGVFYGLMIVMNKFVPKDHRRGIDYLRHRKFKEAIEAFEASADFFKRHSWLDKTRYVTMVSHSAISYRELALCNIGHSYLQMGKKKESEEAYKKALKEYPDSTLARLSLVLLKKGLSLPI